MNKIPFSAAVFFAALLLGARGSAASDPGEHPFLAPLLRDHMVIQRGVPAPFWGWTDPGRKVTLRLGAHVAEATADAKGAWRASFEALPAGGPYTVIVSGPQTQILQDVLVGDVWICSGQSNMEMGVGNVDNAEAEIAAANDPQIRLCTVDRKLSLAPRDAMAGQWAVCTPEAIQSGGYWNGFSAAGYFFARDLRRDVHVPIGLIDAAWSGTPAQAWTSEAALRRDVPDYRPALDELDAARDDQRRGLSRDIHQRFEEWCAKNDPGTAGHWEAEATDASAWGAIAEPGVWEGSGVAELSAFDGVLWLRREFDLPAGAEKKDAVLRFKADDDDTAWVNGAPVGSTFGFAPDRAYTVPASALREGRNVVTVRVLDTAGPGGLTASTQGFGVTVGDGREISLAGPWRYRIGAPLAGTPPLPQDIESNANYPSVLFNGIVHPMLPLPIKGVLWYQGESNVDQAYQYRALLPAMIRDWRRRWGEGDFPFLIVQLAGYGAPLDGPADSKWAELREAQAMTATHGKNIGLMTAADIGGDLHPKNKQEVGRRLALLARSQVYGETIEASGPQFRAMNVVNGAARLTFTHSAGLAAKDNGPLTGFTIAGADRKFVRASARIEGTSVIVSSPEISHPAAVRYAWADNPVCSLVNGAGLPALPFRTDDWPGLTAGAR
ncbi:9-O-acetylesterase [Capsulimonas corticalis]|uniref:9-O-acetylesterase n=1 Tax=Capsulimonas corticalis TaxID=2219043 RepID=A0A402CUL6_9BACT|nr:sialate O-acetylesterase [Capsulimonas corticalis]BDI29004.1 9-O-acetylesterase [Capsulimonas corticalis]